MKDIPFSRPSIGDEEIESVVKCLKSGWLTTGKITMEFEERFREYIGCKYAVAVSSCTAALHISLLVNNIGPGDEVITTPLTFVSTVNVIEMCGATPVFVDIDKETLLIDEKRIEEKINTKTKAIIAVHYGGNACNMDYINSLAKRYNLCVIEDAAHALGTVYKNKRIGNSDNLTCFSFYPTKNMTSIEGGMITSNDESFIEKLKKLRLHGLSLDAWKRYERKGNWQYDVDVLGYKYNMTNISAAIGISQLDKLEGFNQKRKFIVEYYKRRLQRHDGIIKYQKFEESIEPSFFMFVVVIANKDREFVINSLKEKGISVSVLFTPVYKFIYYKNKYPDIEKAVPICESICNKIVCLPLYADMKLEEAEYVMDSLDDILNSSFQK